jgi:hypothetical protein
MINIAADRTATANQELIKIDGITFSGGGASGTLILIVNGDAPKLVITNNTFRDVFKERAIYVKSSGTYGVIANNIFDRVQMPLSCFGRGTMASWGTSSTPIYPFAPGNDKNIFFENNTVQFSSSFSANDNSAVGWVECGQDGRIVMRYNTFDYTNSLATSNDALLDVHGFQNWPTGGGYDSGQTGSFIAEYYGNTWSNFPGNQWQLHRGGQMLMFNNLVVNSTNSTTAIQERVYDLGCNAQVNLVNGQTNFGTTAGKLNGEVHDTYVWNNQRNGAIVNAITDPPLSGPGATLNNSCRPLENAQFWNLNTINCTAAACTAGIGQGTSAPTGTCTVGTGFWVASTLTPTVDPAVIQSGTLYRCTSTNTWTAYYKPFIYPHPLRNGTGGGSPPAAPTNLTVH